jgi:hypothetical protein
MLVIGFSKIRGNVLTDFSLILQFFGNTAIDFWIVVNEYWFIVLPVFIALITNILLVVFGIVPGDHNRKH